MSRNKRIILLLLINIGIIFISLYVLDYLQIFDYRQIFARLPLLRERYTPKVEDPYLLEKFELEKKWQLLEERLKNLELEKRKLEEEMRNIQLEKQNLIAERENVKNMIEEFERSKKEKESYDKRLEELAIQIENMEPKAAVKLLEKQEDMLLVDLLRKIEQRAKKEGRQSIVPYLLTLMDPEQAARIQRKMVE